MVYNPKLVTTILSLNKIYTMRTEYLILLARIFAPDIFTKRNFKSLLLKNNIKISNKTIKEFIFFIEKKKNTKIFINKNVYIQKNFTNLNEYFLDIYITT